MSKCYSCGAEIEWIKYNGKPHPVDAKTKNVFVNVGSTFQLLTGNESHFATCPNAATHRKEKKPDDQSPDF